MATTRKHKDANQLAKSILDQAIGEVMPAHEKPRVIASRKGGQVGGAARAISMSPEQRAEIARIAAQARWKKS